MTRRTRWITAAVVSLSLAALAGGLLSGGCGNNSRRSSGPPATLPSTGPRATLTVKVSDMRSRKGKLIFGVFITADGFPSDQSRSVAWEVKAVEGDTVTFATELPPGTYGASVLHDENENGKMDVNLVGIPKEGYGVTNNPKPKFRAARFSESTFELPAGGREMTISLQYF